MAGALATLVILGFPLYIILGIITFIALLATAILGMLVVRGRSIPFSYHVNMARATIVIAILHGIIVTWAFYF